VCDSNRSDLSPDDQQARSPPGTLLVRTGSRVPARKVVAVTPILAPKMHNKYVHFRAKNRLAIHLNKLLLQHSWNALARTEHAWPVKLVIFAYKVYIFYFRIIYI